MNDFFQNADDGILIAKIRDCKRLCDTRSSPCFVGFLNEHEVTTTVAYLKHMDFYNYKFFGGRENSDRVVFGAFPKGKDMADYMFPISVLSFTYKPQYTLSHRDFLGALMGLGIKRDVVGDILVNDGKSYVFVKDDVKEYIIAQTEKIGSVGVTVCECAFEDIQAVQNFFEHDYTVASMRLDNIVSTVWGQSRDKSAKLIKSGLVAVNSVAITSVSCIIKQGDKVALRGKGKIIISNVGGLTKKGRQKLTIKQYR